MFSDSCSCYRKTGHGCRGHCHTCSCSICDRNKVRRRCQSEGLYQEGDPLKELNWCCDRGCDLLNRSSKCSQSKKTDLQIIEKKMNVSDKVSMDCGHIKHHSKTNKGKVEIEISNLDVNADLELKYSKNQRIFDDKKKLYSSPYENVKYCTIGDTVSSNSKVGYIEKERNSIEMRERYLKEMEILRTKLNLLKDETVTDGKRLRQRSESEPGFTELSGGVPKRARDVSPKMKGGCRKLPMTPGINQLHRFPAKYNMPFQRESKSLSPSALKNSEKVNANRALFSKRFLDSTSKIKELRENESDEDHDDSTCDEDVLNKDDTGNSDDETSLQSSFTSTSNDSNTSSKVGETLSSITLNDISKKGESLTELKNSHTKPVPQNEDSLAKTSLQKNTLFRSSLFPNVPPYVKFFMHDFKGPTLPAEITKHLKWKLSSITPIVIRRTLLNSGFKLVRSELLRGVNVTCGLESNEWTGQWGKHMKSFVFKTLKDFQKLNHFPGTFQIGRKDRLWKNLFRLMTKFGKKEFGFIPKTYILPHDRKLLRTAWEKSSGPGKGQWIVKPPAAARGTGIKVVHKWWQIPKKKSLIVQKYIAQPYLINGSKFDLRLYVLMTSIHPLRIYLYDDGLVRFASVKYSEDVECLSNQFMHLTNYSINKLSTQYQVNADATSCNGHKWSLRSLWTYLTKEGVNVKSLKKNLIDLVIKTIISGESHINTLSKNNLPSRYCSYELFGIDVLLDNTLKPWLLEVNISPSLHSASPLDLAVKGPLVQELLNIAGFQIPAKLTKEQEDAFLECYEIKEKTHTICYDKRLYWTALSKEEKAKHEVFQNLTREEYLDSILADLTPDDVRHLIQFEDELTQIKRFEKIFPTNHTYVYHQFFESPRYYNMVLDAWETRYQKNRKEGIKLLSLYCKQNIHLNVPFMGGKTTSSQSLNDPNFETPQAAEEPINSETGKETEVEVEDKKEKESEKVSIPSPKYPSKIKTSPKPAVVSKPTVLSNHLLSRRPKTTIPVRSSSADDSAKSPLQESCYKMLAEIRQNGLSFTAETVQEKLKSLPNCKLENSIISESLANGNNAISPTKHLHNACIKMNSSS